MSCTLLPSRPSELAERPSLGDSFGALSDLIESNAQSVEGLLQSSGGNQTRE